MLYNITDPREKMMQYQQGAINTYGKRMPEVSQPEKPDPPKTAGGALQMGIGGGYLGQQTGRAIDETGMFKGGAGQAAPPPQPTTAPATQTPAADAPLSSYFGGNGAQYPAQASMQSAPVAETGASGALSSSPAMAAEPIAAGGTGAAVSGGAAGAAGITGTGAVAGGALTSAGATTAARTGGAMTAAGAGAGGAGGGAASGAATGSSFGPYGMLAGAVIGLLAYYLS